MAGGRRKRIGRKAKKRPQSHPNTQTCGSGGTREADEPGGGVSCERSHITLDETTPTNVNTSRYDVQSMVQSFMTIAKSYLSALSNWYMENDRQEGDLRIFNVRHNPIDNIQVSPIAISRLLVVLSDGTWVVHVEGVRLSPSANYVNLIPTHLTADSFRRLLHIIMTYHICSGNSDDHFVDMCQEMKGKFYSSTRQVSASLHGSDIGLSTTIRHCQCDLIVEKQGTRCQACSSYRNKLRAMYSRYKKQLQFPHTPCKQTNDRWLRTPQMKKRTEKLRQRVKSVTRENKMLRRKLEDETKSQGIVMDADLQKDMLEAIDNHSTNIDGMDCNDFKRIFWEQQVSASKAKTRNGVRWHPMFIRWCLNIMVTSPKTYNIIRESNVLRLPSKRTLKDYSHWFTPKIGYQTETFIQLYEDYNLKELPEFQKHFVLAFDEMKIHEGLVFHATTGTIIGFVDTGDINTRLKEFEAHIKSVEEPTTEVATHILAICVRGIFIKLDYPIGQFPTSTISGQDLFNIIWTGVRHLMEIGVTVVVIVADGISNNRKFFKLHTTPDTQTGGITYKAKNIYDPTKYIWFMSDVCHLLKTTRNCWEKSSRDGTRHLEYNGKHILWSHLIDIYERSQADSGLYIGHKLKLEHVQLNSYSRMNVRLAAQVLSKSVADLFKTHRELDDSLVGLFKDTTETERFCRMFNKFFDCLNTRHLYEGEHKRNSDLDPYTSSEDGRLKWLKDDFLTYLENWRVYAMSKVGMELKEKKKLLLSDQTLEGIKITIYSFVEVVPYLLSLDGVKYVFSEKFNQDNVEVFFGKQRAKCGRSDNPTVEQFLYNTQTIRVGRRLSHGWSSNIQRRKLVTDFDESDLCQPLRKRRRTSSSIST